MLAVYASLSCGLSDALAGLTADHAIPVFISIVKWTPFYWGSDRFGSALPLLCSGVRGYADNLFAQSVLCVLLLLCASLLSQAFFTGRREPVARAVAFLLFFVVYNPLFIPLYGINASQGQGMGFLFAGTGLLFMETGGYAALRIAAMCLAVLCIAIAVWVCLSLVVAVPFLCALLLLHGRSCGKTLVFLSVSLVSFCFVYFVLRRHSLAYDETMYAISWPTDIVVAVITICKDALHELIYDSIKQITTAVGVCATCALLFSKADRKKTLLTATLLVMLLATECLVASTNSWVVANDLKGRYIRVSCTLIIFFLLFNTGLVLSRYRRLWPGAVLALLVGFFSHGLPNRLAAFTSVTDAYRTPAMELIASDCGLFTGSYWSSWPLVLAANMLGEGSGDFVPILNISLRSEEVLPALRERAARGNGILCAFNDSTLGGGHYFLDAYAIRVEPLLSFPDILVLAIRSFGGMALPNNDARYLAAMQAKHRAASGQ